MKWVCLSSLFLCVQGLWAQTPQAFELRPISTNQPFVFVVLGDNRGDDSGQQPAAFREILKAVRDQSPAFVLDSGDMIYGHTPDENQLRQQWRLYREAIEPLRVPIFHVPGNHDLWDESSARLYRELWGATYYSFGYGNARFIGLDTESGHGRLGDTQFHWLEQQLANSTAEHVFVFLHRPLFPVDGGIGTSLDAYPLERDRIHHLFVQHQRVIGGIFAGHEHLYNFQRRDGVPYYTSGGAGAPLYAAPELGGFHHFLLVRVQEEKVEVEVKKVAAPQQKRYKAKTITPGQVLESWTEGLFWYAWDHTASVELTRQRASKGRQGLRLNFDLSQDPWPVLVLPLASPQVLSRYDSVSFDIYAPGHSGAWFLHPVLQGRATINAPAVRLQTGWNTITTDLNGPLGSPLERTNISGLEWSLSTESPGSTGYLVFDNLRADHRDAAGRSIEKSLEDFERPLLWRVFDETIRAEIIKSADSSEKSGLLVHLDFARCSRPVIFARLNPPWDLSKVDALQLSLEPSGSLPEDLTIALAFRKMDLEYRSPGQPLDPQSRQMRFLLNEKWLPSIVRQGVEQIEFLLVSTNWVGSGEIRLEKLTAVGGSLIRYDSIKPRMDTDKHAE